MKNNIFKARACLSQRELRQYLNGTMAGKKLHAVEHHLLDCPLCAHAVEGLEKVHAAGTLESEWQDLQQLSEPVKTMPKQRQWLNWAAAAVILVLCTISVLQYRAAKVNEQLFVEYFTAAQPHYLLLRGAQPSSPFKEVGELRAALGYYQSGQFEASIPHFDNHLDTNPEDEQAYFLIANALLAARESERAEHILRQLYTEEINGVDQSQIQWYLALAHVEQGEKDEAIALLHDLSVDAEYKPSAQQLSASLKRGE